MRTLPRAILFWSLLLAALPACADGLVDAIGPTHDAGALDATPTAEALRARREAEAEARAEAERALERQRAERAAEREQARLRAEAEAAERAERRERERVEAERRAFEARWPLYGVAFHFLTRVYAEPSVHAHVVGYLRRGSRFRAGERVPGVGCARGFHPVPGGGFMCRGVGTKIGREPQSFEPSPVPPAIDDALPYAYVWVAHDHEPEYWHLPSVAEEAEARAAIAERLAYESRAEVTAAEALDDSEGGGADEPAEDDGVEAPPPPGSEAAEDDGVEAPPPPGSEVAAEEGAGELSATSASATDTATTAASSATPSPEATEAPALPSYLRSALRRGFYLSIDHEERGGGRRFLRTVRGGYVRADAVTQNEPPSHRGVVIGGAWRLPIAFVYRGGAHRLRRDPATGRLSNAGVAERLSPFVVAEEIERRHRGYAVSSEGYLVRSSALRVARSVERPRGVGEDERWIHVDLDAQTLVAYVGDEARFATVVSSGRAGHDTPTGLFHIESKHLSTTMDDLNAGEESYLIEDVPWTMYFEGNFALHAAFWHSAFGRVKSHGCVNLAPADARFLFQWSGPNLPASWHGVFAQRGQPGTAVWITRTHAPSP